MESVAQAEVTAEVMQFYAQLALSDSVVNSVCLQERLDIALPGLVYSLTIGLLGKPTKTDEYDDVVATYPATMWEELKRYWPRWLRRRYPVRFTREIRHRTVRQYHVCPHLDWPKTDARHVEWLSDA